MSLRENLAGNLRLLCRERGPVAKICREMKINRQQFDRYLTGEALPNAATMTKICQYFGVDESELVKEPPLEGVVARTGNAASSSIAASCAAIFNQIADYPAPALQAGLYLTYFSIPELNDKVLCSVTVIRHDRGGTSFRRMTGLSERRGTHWSFLKGDHQGIVMERMHWVYFIAVNRVDGGEPSIAALRWAPRSEPLLCGHAMVVTPSGPSMTTIAMRPAPKGISLRRALQLARVYDFSDEAVGPLVESALKSRYMPIT